MEAVCLEENLPVDRFEVVIANTLWCADITELKYCKGPSISLMCELLQKFWGEWHRIGILPLFHGHIGWEK